MTQANGNPSNGNGQKDYKPDVEFEYLDADVWIEKDAQGNQDVAYTADILKALEEDENSESNGN